MINIYGATDRGGRDQNEDAFVIDQRLQSALVADGMGGHDCGELASAIVCERTLSALGQGRSVVAALQEAHQAVLVAGEERQMGATAVLAQYRKNRLQVAWVGDSRAYLWDGQLHLLSHDHSLVQEWVDQGELDPEAVRWHPQRNIVTQALGIDSQHLQVGHVTVPAANGLLLLCSDGIWEVLDEAQLAEILATADSPERIPQQLIDAALPQAGDNLTAVLMVLNGRTRKNKKLYFAFGLCVLLIVLVLLLT